MPGQPLIDLTAEVDATIGVIQSATALIEGFDERLTAAVADALANGATPEELVPLTALSAALKAEKDALAAAVATHQ